MNNDQVILHSKSAMPRHHSWFYRPPDRALYLAFFGYLALAAGAMTMLHESSDFIEAGTAFCTWVPAFALLNLIIVQVLERACFSPLAFCLVLAGLVLSVFTALYVAGSASAAV